MKSITLFITCIAPLLLSCGGEKKTETDPQVTQIESIYAADSARFRQAAIKLVGLFTEDLQAELRSAMSGGGPVEAIAACNSSAPAIANAYSAGSWSIKRVSDKFRNPDNRADSAELAVLARFASPDSPVGFADWPESDTGQTFRFYKPIGIKSLCLKCHGDLQTLAPGVYKNLKKHYPLDRAVGYRAGDLRGMFVVEATWPEGKEFAELLLSGQWSPTDSAAVDSLTTDSL